MSHNVTNKTNWGSNPSLRLAFQRLTRDMKQLEREQLVGVSARPLEDDLLEWHVNVQADKGHLAQVCIHFEMIFPTEYPLKPPRIKCLTPFGHSNIFSDGYICLSILDDRYGHSDWKWYEKWSSAYSLVTVLLQLQSFVLDENRINRSSERDIVRLKHFVCNSCGHHFQEPFPKVWTRSMLLRSNEVKRREKWQVSKNKSVRVPWNELAYDVLGILFSFLDSVSMRRAAWTTKDWHAVITKYNLMIRNEMVCYFTKLNYRECILGFAMSGTISNFKNDPYKMHLDYLSDVAWKSGVRTPVFENAHLLQWIPIVINAEHGRRAHKLLMTRLRDVTINPLYDSICDALAKLMNGIVVGLAKYVTNARAGFVATDEVVTMSEKAVIGYFALHQNMLWLLQHEERYAQIAKERVQPIVDGVEHCVQVPDLGEALVYLSCVDDVSWEDIRQNFVFETWCRNVSWYVREDRSLAAPTSDNYRRIFGKTSVSRAIVGFQVFFVTEVRSGGTIAEILQKYNENLGRPSQESVSKLHAFCKTMANMEKRPFSERYQFYWDSMKIQPPSHEFFVKYLEATTATANSRRPRHRNGSSRDYSRRRKYGNRSDAARSGTGLAARSQHSIRDRLSRSGRRK